MNIITLLKQHKVIAAVKDDESLELALLSKCKIIFILYGNICNIVDIVKKIKGHNKYAFVHVDLLDGLSSREIVISFLKKNSLVDGIISTKASMIKAAKANNLYAVHRIFVLDSISFNNVAKQASQSTTDCLEILPGCMPKVLKWVTEATKLPIIAGGLVCDEEDALIALKAGAIAISSTNKNIWDI